MYECKAAFASNNVFCFPFGNFCCCSFYSVTYVLVEALFLLGSCLSLCGTNPFLSSAI